MNQFGSNCFFDIAESDTKLLFEAIKRNDIGAVWMLVRSGCDINAHAVYPHPRNNREFGYSPLTFAIVCRNEAMVSHLLGLGADVLAVNRWGNLLVWQHFTWAQEKSGGSSSHKLKRIRKMLAQRITAARELLPEKTEPTSDDAEERL